MHADITPGGTFPDYELTDHTETRRKLSKLQGNDPMIVVLSRGHYCPKDHQQHLELAAAYPKIAVAYTQVVTISTDNIVESREFRASVGAQWTFLSDAGRKVQKDLDIQDEVVPGSIPGVGFQRDVVARWATPTCSRSQRTSGAAAWSSSRMRMPALGLCNHGPISWRRATVSLRRRRSSTRVWSAG